MPLKVAVQMDHVSTINPRGDSTFAMMLEAQARGHELIHYTADTLSLRDNVVTALVQPITVTDAEKGQHFALGEARRVDLSTQDVLLMRQDPPFNMNYITITHILERLRRQVEQTADPALLALLTELRGLPGGAPLRVDHDAGAVAVPLRLRTEAGELAFLSTTTVFGTPVDVTLSELAIEAFLPADARTAEVLRAS